jgi:hypothetical protein
VAISTVTLDREMTIPDCSVRNLEGKVVIITGPGCAGCPRTITQMETIEKDLGKTFVFLDTAEDASAISDMGIATEFLPVILFDCEAYLGEKSDLFLKTQAEAV